MFGRLLERSPVYALPCFIQEHVHATSLNHICFSSSGENVPSEVARTTFVARSFVNAAGVLLPFDSAPCRGAGKMRIGGGARSYRRDVGDI